MFFLGHSHIVSLEDAANLQGVRYKSLNLWGFGRPVLYDEPGGRLEPVLAAMLDDFVISTVGGSAHDLLGLAQHPHPFDFVLPEAPDLPIDPSADILPVAAVRGTVSALMEGEQLDLIRLLARPGRRVVHLESPPPVGEDERLGREMFHAAFVPRAATGPSSPWLRYKLWRVHSALVQAACDGFGVEFLSAPTASMTDGKFLRTELYDRPCHANADYGLLVLRTLGLAS